MASREKLSKSEQALLQSFEQSLLAGPRLTAISETTIQELNRLLLQALRTPVELTQIVGPVCTTGSATAWLGISRQGLYKAVADNRIIAVQTSDGKWFYPTWQFRREKFGSEQIPALVTRLRTGLNNIEIASWFITTNEKLSGLSPVQWLEQNRDPELLKRQAKAAGISRKTRQTTPNIHSTTVQSSYLD